jgi:hypothetical protein
MNQHQSFTVLCAYLLKQTREGRNNLKTMTKPAWLGTSLLVSFTMPTVKRVIKGRSAQTHTLNLLLVLSQVSHKIYKVYKIDLQSRSETTSLLIKSY